MAEERLSSLQKWILIQAYNAEKNFYAVSKIYAKFFGIDKEKSMEQMEKENKELWAYEDASWRDDYSKRIGLVESVNQRIKYLRRQKAPIVSKSLKRLREKGLITQPSYKSYCDKRIYHKWRVELTTEGEAKAEELLKKEAAPLL